MSKSDITKVRQDRGFETGGTFKLPTAANQITTDNCVEWKIQEINPLAGSGILNRIYPSGTY
jgi:hypothetical protein